MTGRGRLIVLEGGEGAGKSTQLDVVANWLEARGRPVRRTREPGGSPLAEAIRGLVLDDWPEGMDAHTELLLIFAARAAHLHATIAPALATGVDVVSDRFVDASYAYQGAGRGLDLAEIATLETLVLGDLRPDLVLLLDLPADAGLRRARARGDENRFESETAAFQQRVREMYLARATAAPQTHVVIDASPEAAVVSRAIERVLEQRL